jgi:hypothetical protein
VLVVGGKAGPGVVVGRPQGNTVVDVGRIVVVETVDAGSLAVFGG